MATKRKAIPVRKGQRTKSSRWQEEKRQALMLWGFGGLVLVLVAFIAFYGAYQNNILPWEQLQSTPRHTFFKAPGVSYNMEYYLKRVRMFIRQNNIPLQDPVQGDQQLRSAPQGALALMRQEEIAVLGAPDLGISVSQDEISAEIAKRLQLSADADSQTFQGAYARELRITGLSDREYRRMIEGDLLTEKIQGQLAEQTPTTVPMVSASFIGPNNLKDAQEIKRRIDAGESFDAIKAQFTENPNPKIAVWDMGWLPVDVLDKPLGETLYSLNEGEISGIKEAPGSVYYIAKLVGKSDSRELTEDQRKQLSGSPFLQWQRDYISKIQISVRRSDLDWLLKRISP